jgi:dTDP-4-amino-4,6-dideoxygalactose transaminase
MMKKIPLSLATMGGREMSYIKEAFDSNWIAPLGPNVDGFERDLGKYLTIDPERVVALGSGTAAIHLALIQIGVGPGDEVVCQSFTFAASANPIVYLGATPVLVDSEPDTWNISPELLEEAILDRRAATGHYPKAIIAADLYGMPCRMGEVREIAARYSIPVIEDSAEALGSNYGGKACGTLGDWGILSFNGNKIITTSGGGALVCPTGADAARTLFLATQARENRPYYHHETVGYNYRLSNVCAGIGRGQMEALPRFTERRRAIHSLYRKLLERVEGIKVMKNPEPRFDSNFWLTCITLEDKISPDALRLHLAGTGIEARLLWKPLHLQPVFAAAPAYVDGTAERLFDRGLCLPSGAGLSDGDIERVAKEIMVYVGR